MGSRFGARERARIRSRFRSWIHAERLQGYLKADLREVTRDTKSLMPDFGPDRLNDEDLGDLLAYLGTLRVRNRRPNRSLTR